MRQLLAGGVHDVDVLGQRLAHRAGQRLGAAVLDQAAADLGLDGAAELLDARLELVRRQPLLQLGQRRRRPRPAWAWPIRRSSTPSRSRFRSVRYR